MNEGRIIGAINEPEPEAAIIADTQVSAGISRGNRFRLTFPTEIRNSARSIMWLAN